MQNLSYNQLVVKCRNLWESRVNGMVEQWTFDRQTNNLSMAINVKYGSIHTQTRKMKPCTSIVSTGDNLRYVRQKTNITYRCINKESTYSDSCVQVASFGMGQIIIIILLQ